MFTAAHQLQRKGMRAGGGTAGDRDIIRQGFGSAQGSNPGFTFTFTITIIKTSSTPTAKAPRGGPRRPIMGSVRQPGAGAAAPRPKRQKQANVRHGPPTAAAPPPSEARRGQQPAVAAWRPGSSCRGLMELAEALLASPPDSPQGKTPLPAIPAVLPVRQQRSQTPRGRATGILRLSQTPFESCLPAFEFGRGV